jgi:hypothetical protein
LKIGPSLRFIVQATTHDIAHDNRFHLIGRSFARATAATIATAPRLGAGTSLRLPPKVPIAVRTDSAKTT